MYTRRVSLALATTLMALVVSAAGATASDTSYFGIHVANGNNPNFLTFRSAKCRLHTKSFFEAVAFDRGWELNVQLHHFTGFHRYKLERGHYNGTFLPSSLRPGSNMPVTSSRQPTSPAAVRSTSATTAACWAEVSPQCSTPAARTPSTWRAF